MRNIKSLLITGGTGSFGKTYTNYILEKVPSVRRLVIFSRDELKQFEMQNEKFFAQNVGSFLSTLLTYSKEMSQCA